jgi:hypothetical protein
MEHQNTAESLWYALRVRTKTEKIVAGGLNQRDIVNFLPLYKKKHSGPIVLRRVLFHYSPAMFLQRLTDANCTRW